MNVRAILTKKLLLKEIIMLVVVLATIRVIIEWTLLSYPIELDGIQDYIRFYLENVYYFVIGFLLIAIALATTLRKQLQDVANFGMRMYTVILLPPLLDYIFFSHTQGYPYATTQNFMGNLFTISIAQGDASKGIIIELLVALGGVAWYAYVQTKSIFRTIAAGFVTTLIITVISTPDIFFGQGKGDFYYDYFLPLYYFIPLLIGALGIVFYYNQQKGYALLIGLRPCRALKFMIITALGVWASYVLNQTLNWYHAVYVIFAIFFVRQCAVALNDIYDYQIDKISNPKRPLVRKILTKQELYTLAGVCGAFAISFSAIINLKVLAAVSIGLFFGLAYSVPPLRLRKNVLGHIVIAISVVLCFAAGLLVSGTLADLADARNIKFGAWLLLIGLTTSFSKDLKDIKGDKKNNVKNLFTLWGIARGKMLLSALLLVSFLFPMLFIKSVVFIVTALFVACMTILLYNRYGNEQIVYHISSLFGIFVFYMLYVN